MYCLTNYLFFNIPLLYYYTNLNSSIIWCLFPGAIYLSFGISSPSSFCERNTFECNSFRDFEIFANLSAILLSIKSPVASAVS